MEDNNPTPVPAPEKKKQPGPFSVRPKGEELAFLEALVEAKGGAQNALLECIQLAMKAKGEIIQDKPTPKPESKPETKIVGYVPAGQVKERLTRIQNRKGITEHEAIEYCITNHI